MSVRTEKVSEEIKHKINEVLTRDLSELDLGLVTVTKVVMSRDLKTSKIYLSFFGNKQTGQKCIDKINFRKKQIRMHLGSRIYLKAVPELLFYYDDSLEYANKIDELIKEIHKDDL
ncbi:MAG: 30S ribosome-binding factor RbfA [Ignavibacteria bacterium]|jgi:ribosome-binding factor A